GGLGMDRLKGSADRDVFDFNNTNESAALVGSRDHILDFQAGTATTSIDRIDVSGIGADQRAGPSGNQTFTLVGAAAFQAGVAGELRLIQVGSHIVVAGDVNGDKVADLQIEIDNTVAVGNITALDFVL